jgi:hypothetical protein
MKDDIRLNKKLNANNNNEYNFPNDSNNEVRQSQMKIFICNINKPI